MHTLLDYDGNLPAYVNITNGKTADKKGVYDVPLLKSSVIVADRFYNDFPLLNVWGSNGVFFVIRHKENIQFETVQEKEQTIEIITNQISWIANKISELYKSRWQNEIFFREIKQLLHIKSFFGTSEKCSYDPNMDGTDNHTCIKNA